ncbi:hypothetical protein [Ascidiaceihabitans sp.]|uniref:hypothetical protein n=1 Tax=Ascidiaceihabitans sp. TaxID=1872644 RepID=UPI00329693BF
MRAIDTHPDVLCYAHPFFPDILKTPRFSKLDPNKVDVASRYDRPLEYITDLMSHRRNKLAVGLKIWPIEGDTACMDAIKMLGADETIKKIRLFRENELAAFSSWQLVREKNAQPHLFKPGLKKPKITFRKKLFVTFLERRRAWRDASQNLAKGDVLTLPYEGLTGEGLQRAAAFLNLTLPHSFKTPSEKRNSNDILGRFEKSEHRRLLRTLDQIGHPEWVSEGA